MNSYVYRNVMRPGTLTLSQLIRQYTFCKGQKVSYCP